MTTSWHGSPNFWRGRRLGPPVAIVLHTMAGSIRSADAWFTNPASEVSAHYGVALNGDIHAYVRTADTAWANGIVEEGSLWPQIGTGNPNWTTCSIETEDLDNPNEPVTPEQFSSVRTLVRTIVSRYGPQYLLGHSQISPRTRPDCPGGRWYDSGEFDQLALDTGCMTLA